MPGWWSAVLFLLVLVVVLALPFIGLVARRRWLAARGWVVDCTLRFRSAAPGSGWMLGVARFNEEDLEWYRILSLDIRPRVVVRRGEALISVTRPPTREEGFSLYGEQRLVDVETDSLAVTLALSPDDMMAFLSWSEAGAPGSPFKI